MDINAKDFLEKKSCQTVKFFRRKQKSLGSGLAFAIVVCQKYFRTQVFICAKAIAQVLKKREKR